MRSSLKPVVLESDSTVTQDDKCCVITPDFGTYHEILAVNGPVAFLDVLAPSYDHHTGSRICQYYKELQGDTVEHHGKLIKWFTPVGQPNDFWCEPEDYRGPSVVEAIKDLCLQKNVWWLSSDDFRIFYFIVPVDVHYK